MLPYPDELMFPYAGDRRERPHPVVTIMLLSLNLLLWAALVLCDRYLKAWPEMRFVTLFGIVPAHFRPWTLLTYQFVHANFGHLLTNLCYLWVFGAGVEQALGKRWFLLLYLAGGIVGGALQALVTALLVPQSAHQPIVGASAACAGLIGLFAVYYYRARLAFVGLPFRPHVVYVVAAFLALEIGSGFWELMTGSTAGGAAHWAHVGGFLFGLSIAHLFQLDRAGERAYLVADAAQQMDKSQLGGAIQRWEALLLREPDNTRAQTELARAWMLLGDTEQATLWFLRAIETHLRKNRRRDAARLYIEMRERGLRTHGLTIEQLFLLGYTLEEIEAFDFAADTLRAAVTRAPNAQESETALLRVIYLFIHQLDRKEEAQILLRLFLERYPHSPWRSLADELQRAASS